MVPGDGSGRMSLLISSDERSTHFLKRIAFDWSISKSLNGDGKLINSVDSTVSQEEPDHSDHKHSDHADKGGVSKFQSVPQELRSVRL